MVCLNVNFKSKYLKILSSFFLAIIPILFHVLFSGEKISLRFSLSFEMLITIVMKIDLFNILTIVFYAKNGHNWNY